jgi:hypothetical protein
MGFMLGSKAMYLSWQEQYEAVWMPLLRYIFFLTGVVVVAGGLHPLLSLGFDAFVSAFASALYLLLLLKPFWPSFPGHFQPFYPLLQSPFKPFLRPSHLLCAPGSTSFSAAFRACSISISSVLCTKNLCFP